MRSVGIFWRASGLICALVCFLSCEAIDSVNSASAESQAAFSRGINLAGADGGSPDTCPGVYGKDYIYPTPQEVEYYASKGFAVVRLPYRWERLQRSLFGELDKAELNRIKSVVAAAGARKMQVILDPHNFGRYVLDGKLTLIGTAG